MSDLQQELPVVRELEDVPIAGTAAADPDVALGIDGDAVLGVRPFVAGPRPAPRLHDVAGLIEFNDRRRSHAAFRLRRRERRRNVICRQRARPRDDPDVILRVHENRRGLPERPVVRKWFRPERIDHKRRYMVSCCRNLSSRGPAGQDAAHSQHCDHRQQTGTRPRPSSLIASCCHRTRFLACPAQNSIRALSSTRRACRIP